MDAMIDKQRTILDEGERVKAVQDIVKYVAGKMYVLSSVGSYKYSLIRAARAQLQLQRFARQSHRDVRQRSGSTRRDRT